MPLTQVSPGLLDTQANAQGFRNRIINGDCRVDQRNAGASVTGNNGVFPVDRFKIAASQSSKMTAQQSTTAPTGFSNSLLITSSSAYSVAAGDYFGVEHVIEGFNTADLGWGTASAQTVTLSFWVRSSLTGTFSVSIRNYGSYNRSYAATYTISAANTWEQKTITIAGDTTGTWTGASNNGSFLLDWGLGVGSTYSTSAGSWTAGNFIAATGATSVVGTNGATLYIAGVQLEKGTAATDFERLDYGRQLMQCQRYFEKSYNIATTPGTATSTGRAVTAGNAGATTTGFIEGYISWKVNKRATPTVTIYDMAGNSGKCTRLSTGIGTSDNQGVATNAEGENASTVFSSGSASGNCLQLHYTASAEL